MDPINQQVALLQRLQGQPLKDIQPDQAAQVVYRIVDKRQQPKLDVSAFNSSI